MSPYREIYQKYQQERPEVDFPALIGHHLQFGFVYSTPDFFVMGRPVPKNAASQLILDPNHFWGREHCDCWYLHAFAGRMDKVWKVMPYPLKFCAWTRIHDKENELTIVSFEDLQRLCPPDHESIETEPALAP